MLLLNRLDSQSPTVHEPTIRILEHKSLPTVLHKDRVAYPRPFMPILRRSRKVLKSSQRSICTCFEVTLFTYTGILAFLSFSSSTNIVTIYHGLAFLQLGGRLCIFDPVGGNPSMS